MGGKEESTWMAARLGRCLEGGTAFHNAGLLNEQRALVETQFRKGRVKCIVATTTLAAGLNLPARRVIVRDLNRYDVNFGFTPIPVLEVKQMCGRAGRPKYDKIGEAILIAKEEDDVEDLIQEYFLGPPEPIESKLSSEPALRFHTLAAVATDYANTEGELFDFYGRNFFGHKNPVEEVRGRSGEHPPDGGPGRLAHVRDVQAREDLQQEEGARPHPPDAAGPVRDQGGTARAHPVARCRPCAGPRAPRPRIPHAARPAEGGPRGPRADPRGRPRPREEDRRAAGREGRDETACGAGRTPRVRVTPWRATSRSWASGRGSWIRRPPSRSCRRSPAPVADGPSSSTRVTSSGATISSPPWSMRDVPWIRVRTRRAPSRWSSSSTRAGSARSRRR